MSLEQLVNVVPCSKCKKNMVPLGKMGDNGTKKCEQCLKDEARVKQRGLYQKRRLRILKHINCVRCGDEIPPIPNKMRSELCTVCKLKIKYEYHESHNRKCVYCGKSSGRNAYCSRACLAKTLMLFKDRSRKK